jgi:hypothetical protein
MIGKILKRTWFDTTNGTRATRTTIFSIDPENRDFVLVYTSVFMPITIIAQITTNPGYFNVATIPTIPAKTISAILISNAIRTAKNAISIKGGRNRVNNCEFFIIAISQNQTGFHYANDRNSYRDMKARTCKYIPSFVVTT